MTMQHEANITETAATVVLVGHCGPDQFMLRSTVERALPGASIEMVNDGRSLEAHLHAGSILLVNRVLDGRFATAGGIDLIEQIARDHDAAERPVMLLISDLPDAQQQAEQGGARPGFGKRDLYEQQTIDRLRGAAASTSPA